MIARNFKSAAIALLLATSLSGCSDGAGKPVSLVDKIKERGTLNCSGSQGVPGLSRPDEKGVWRGFDSDVCRALAAAILGDAQKGNLFRSMPHNASRLCKRAKSTCFRVHQP